MPLIKVQTSLPPASQGDVEALLLNLSRKLAAHLGKPESYVMTAFEAGIPMTFGGSIDPACYVEIKSVGTMGDHTRTMSEDFCNEIHQSLGVAKNRIYIEFADAKGSMWGWNGSTFG
ncbi:MULTISPECIES: phenylpyruvate tautomerase MIF-related protein [Cyanophyceae]|uniref:phenylpyruvate tautomerase MIF-related protein n=1 Tax=Cyanophyceae TaxID=3028117 RepID=UPI00016DC3E4|nr:MULTISPECIES: phenylpyruvate tautomerase MIF-related protein [Cyanophyceae]ACA98574.1 possible ATLS1-like light-inducible protein [Picosynechococcus sp. PCC 7002]SMH40975.1 Macrophage migration inhibitory factor (MIF) [Picosynechococcus sp. OG1]SMQ78491.1 Macrophage migration inhibitory factor (MIF) [Synechococcus sp. 7002]